MKQADLHRWQTLLCAFLLMILASTAWASGTVSIQQGFGHVALGPHLEYLKDSERSFNLADVRARSAAFSPNDAEVFNPGYTSAGYWVRFRLRNTESKPQSVFLQYQTRFADHLRLYSPDENGIYSVIHSGRLIAPSERPLPSREFLFPIELAAASERTFYFYADSADTLTIPLHLFDAKGLSASDLTDQSWLMFYQGLIFAMTIFSMFLFNMLRSWVYFFYILTIALHHGLFFALFDGMGYAYFGLEDPWWSREALSVLLSVTMATMIQFSRALLNTPQESARLDKALVTLMLLALVTAVFSIFVDYSITIRIANPIASFTATMLWISGWISLRKGNPAARYFLLAWTFIIIGGLAYSLKSWGFAPSNLFTEYGWQVGSAIEALLLSMAIAARIQVEMSRREQSQLEARSAQAHALEIQRHSNDVLEQRVQQRTEELETANHKLQTMSITDGLTGLHNRRHFQQKLEAESHRARREKEMLAVIMLDIDQFKQFNDSYGHRVGDACLRQVSQTLESQLKRTTDCLARYGGEEFIILLPHAAASGAEQVGQRMRQSVESLDFRVEGQRVPITVSVGVAIGFPSAEADAERLVQIADEALYQSKRDGRNRLTLVDLSKSGMSVGGKAALEIPGA